MTKIVTLVERVRVYDPEAVIAYAEAHEEDWGFQGEEWTLELAVREALVQNDCRELFESEAFEIIYSRQDVEDE